MVAKRLSTAMLRAFPPILAIIAFVFVVIPFLAGVNGKLTSLHFLRVDVRNLAVPSKLSNSTILADLGGLSNTDLIGQEATAISLGLAEAYTVHLLTTCAHFRGGAVSCASARFGTSFSPAVDLRLDPWFSSLDVNPAVRAHADQSLGLSIRAVVASALLFPLAPAIGLLCHLPLVAALLTALSAIIVLSLAAGEAVVFRRLREALSHDFGHFGLVTELDWASVGLTAAGLVVAIILAASLLILARTARRERAMTVGAYEPGGDGYQAFLRRVPTWRQGTHLYAQLRGKDKGGKGRSSRGDAMLLGRGEARVARGHENWDAGDDEFLGRSRGTSVSGGENVEGTSMAMEAMPTFGENKKTLVANTAYEPYAAQRVHNRI